MLRAEYAKKGIKFLLSTKVVGAVSYTHLKVAISLATKGANENGLIEMYRRPVAERTAFDLSLIHI